MQAPSSRTGAAHEQAGVVGAEDGGQAGPRGAASLLANRAVGPFPKPLDGTLRFIRYGFMPNRLQYCGPTGENRTLFEYGVEQVVDGGLTPLLRRFTGALPYLQLIARSNGIADPFDVRVV